MMGRVLGIVHRAISAHLIQKAGLLTSRCVDATLEIHAAAYSHVLPLSEKLGINTELPKVISDSFESALNQGYKDSELSALFEVLSKRG